MPIICPREAGFIDTPQPERRCHTCNYIGGRAEKGSLGREGRGIESRATFESAVSEAIWVTLPDGPGQRNRKLFDLARRVKGLPTLADADFSSLEPIVRDWRYKALSAINTKEWEETWKDFCIAWIRVKVPVGNNPIHEMIRVAVNGREPPEANAYSDPAVRKLVAA
jgi:hypothetical protein